MDDIIEVLYKCIIFKGLDKAQIRLVLSRTRYHIKEYGKNEFICREDQFSEYVGIIIWGSIEIQKVLASGNLICIFHKNKGDLFGGAVVFSTETTYPCDVFSRVNSKIFFSLSKVSLKCARKL